MTTRDDDLLTQAMRALRDSHVGAVDDPRPTKDRVLVAARVRRQKRLTLVRVVLPIAAILVGSLAWAAATGRLAAIFHATGAAEQAPVAPASATAAPGPSPPVVEPTVPPDEPVPATNPSQPATAPVPYERLPDAQPTPRGSSSSAPSASGSAAAALEREDKLYETAHRRHFVDRDPNGALVAWDAYLSEFPRGRFAPEARYNRALSLVRLGRRAEAKEALSPFARGEHGAYRQHEAEQLLEQLGAP